MNYKLFEVLPGRFERTDKVSSVYVDGSKCVVVLKDPFSVFGRKLKHEFGTFVVAYENARLVMSNINSL